MKPRILFLNHTGEVAGGELFLVEVAQHYAESSGVVLFAQGPLRKQLEKVGVAVEVLPAPPAVSSVIRGGSITGDLQALPGILKLAWHVAQRSDDYDLMYANSQKALIIGALAGMIARRPVVWHQHDVLSPEHFSRAHRWLVVALANHAIERVVACSKTAADALVKCGGRAERVHVVYNGIDPTPFEAITPAEVDELRRALGLVGVKVVGLFGRLSSYKGQHVLLEALARLPGVHALLVGEAIFGESAYAKGLREQARTLEIANRVHFLGFRQDVPRLMRLCDIVVLASIGPESFGRVILEGMLAHKPIVATRLGGTGELIEDQVSGILVSPGNAKALAKVIAELLANPTKVQALAKAGYTAASERFSLQAMLKGVEQQIQDVLALRR
jgi:glycosyltransferase involved in cell wall biosynthesis